MFFVYILYSPHFDRYYIGQTENLENRLIKHNLGQVISTQKFKPWQMVYNEAYLTRSLAMKREKEIKMKKSRKYIEFLISSGINLDSSRF